MSTKPRVLIVDDEPDVVDNWSRLLGREDYACITATDGERALSLLESERPEIVLTDLKMPRADGMQVLARALDVDPDAVTIALPPLRDRAGDVALLAHHFLRRYGRNRDHALDGIEPAALAQLEAYAWPGNVRELQNVVERACALTDGPTIRVRDLPEHIRGRGRPAPAVPGKDLPLAEARQAWVQAFAQEYLTDLLRRHGGNISQAAKTAGVDRKTLHRLLAKHGIKA